MAAITCPADCTDALPAVLFSDCSPEVNLSEIVAIFLSKGSSTPFTDWKVASEWTQRMGTPANADDKIIALSVIGDKPVPGKQEIAISNFRKKTLPKDHSINFEIDESNDTNHDFVRNMECGGSFRVWYATASGHLFGGNQGITKSTINIDMSLERGENSVQKYPGTITWKSKHTEERVTAPFPVM